MTTSAPKTSIPKTPEQAAAQVVELNDKLTADGKRLGAAYLDGYDRTVASVVAFQRALAEQAPVPAFKSVLAAQADLTAELSQTYSAVAREALV
jgi:hypothetical protein